jgi:hypothetical protein
VLCPPPLPAAPLIVKVQKTAQMAQKQTPEWLDGSS